MNHPGRMTLLPEFNPSEPGLSGNAFVRCLAPRGSGLWDWDVSPACAGTDPTLEAWRPASARPSRRLRELEAGAIAKTLTEHAGWRHYWLRDPRCVRIKLRPNTIRRKLIQVERFGKAVARSQRQGHPAKPE